MPRPNIGWKPMHILNQVSSSVGAVLKPAGVENAVGILTTGYLGGALWTHLRVGDTWFFPIIIGVLLWLGLALRRPAIFRLLLGQESTA